MDALSSRDLQLVLNGAYDLLGVEDLAGFPAAVLEVVARLVPSDIVSYNEIDLQAGTATALTLPDDVLFPEAGELLARHAGDNPLIVFQSATGDGTPRRISDFITLGQLRRRPLHSQLYRRLGVNYQLAVGLGTMTEAVVGVAFNRGALDFTERDVAALEALRPFLTRIRGRLIAAAAALPDADAGQGTPLTHRQAQVLGLVAQGATNRDVAARLMISEHTVAKHLENAYRALGVRNRTAAIAAWRHNAAG